MIPKFSSNSSFFNKGGFTNLITNSYFHVYSWYLYNIIWMFSHHLIRDFSLSDNQIIHIDRLTIHTIITQMFNQYRKARFCLDLIRLCIISMPSLKLPFICMYKNLIAFCNNTASILDYFKNIKFWGCIFKALIKLRGNIQKPIYCFWHLDRMLWKSVSRN